MKIRNQWTASQIEQLLSMVWLLIAVEAWNTIRWISYFSFFFFVADAILSLTLAQLQRLADKISEREVKGGE